MCTYVNSRFYVSEDERTLKVIETPEVEKDWQESVFFIVDRACEMAMDTTELNKICNQIFEVYPKDERTFLHVVFFDEEKGSVYISDGARLWCNDDILRTISLKQKVVASLRQKTVELTRESKNASSKLVLHLTRMNSQFPFVEASSESKSQGIQTIFLKLAVNFFACTSELKRIHNVPNIDVTQQASGSVDSIPKPPKIGAPGMSIMKSNVRKRKVPGGLKYEDS